MADSLLYFNPGYFVGPYWATDYWYDTGAAAPIGEGPQWPAALPQLPLYQGFQETSPVLILRTNMDIGAAKVRRRYTAGVRLFKVRFALTADQVVILDTFFLETVAGGAVAFNWTHPRTGAPGVFRFTTQPQFSAAAPDVWWAEVALELLP